MNLQGATALVTEGSNGTQRRASVAVRQDFP